MTDEQKYTALVEKDAAYDGAFFAGVKTTGIFCRTTCTARKPKRENVTFYDTIHDALAAGYRPCKICRPLERKKKKKNLVVAGGYLPPLSLAARSKNDYKNPTG